MKNIVLAFTILLFAGSCGGGGGKEEAAGTVDNGNTKAEVKKEEMTPEKYCKLDLEKAQLLMDKYWNTFKDKDYADVKDEYAQYEKDLAAINKKYGIKDEQKLVYWARDHRTELKKYRADHPDYDIYSLYPEFADANVKLYHYAMAEFKDK